MYLQLGFAFRVNMTSKQNKNKQKKSPPPSREQSTNASSCQLKKHSVCGSCKYNKATGNKEEIDLGV